MSRIGITRLCWRRLTCWIAVYALVLQGILVGLAAAHQTTDAGLGYEICLHDADGSSSVPNSVPGGHDGTIHCPFCLAGQLQIVPPARPLLLGFVVRYPGRALLPVSDRHVANYVEGLSQRPRGPPVRA